MPDADPRDPSPENWRRMGMPPCGPPREEWKPCYLRYGDPPPGGRSMNYDLGIREPGVSVFAAWRTPEGGYVIDLRSSVIQAICFVRMSRLRPAYLAEGRLVGYGSAREPLLEVTSMEPVSGGVGIRPNAGLPRRFVETVLYVLRLEMRTGRKI